VKEWKKRHSHTGRVSTWTILIASSAQIKREKGSSHCFRMRVSRSSLPWADTEEHYDSLFNANVKAFSHGTEGASLYAGRSSIILNASIVSIKGTPEWSVYSATKAAVRSFRGHGLDLKGRRIRVTR